MKGLHLYRYRRLTEYRILPSLFIETVDRRRALYQSVALREDCESCFGSRPRRAKRRKLAASLADRNHTAKPYVSRVCRALARPVPVREVVAPPHRLIPFLSSLAPHGLEQIHTLFILVSSHLCSPALASDRELSEPNLIVSYRIPPSPFPPSRHCQCDPLCGDSSLL